MEILETIFRRTAVRSYEPQPADATLLEEVRRTGEAAEALTGAEMRFYLHRHEEMGKEVKGVIGDYGKTIRAPHYIVLASRESDGYLTDAGFRFEQMILDATGRGLGTCWVGLMFKEASLRSFLGLDPSWRVIALTPIGLPAGPTFVSRALRSMARSSTRKPIDQIFFWQSHGEQLPSGILAQELLARLLEAVRWAPSWMNKQPWFFIFTGSEVLIYKKRRQSREGKDYHLLDCGIAMAHLQLAAHALGFGGQWTIAKFEVPGEPDAEPIGRYPLVIKA